MQISTVNVMEQASGAGDPLKALASRHRLMIVCRLIGGGQCVGALAVDLDLRQALVSRHLAILRRWRVVEARRSGQTIRYHLTNGVARAVADVLVAHFCAIKTIDNHSS